MPISAGRLAPGHDRALDASCLRVAGRLAAAMMAWGLVAPDLVDRQGRPVGSFVSDVKPGDAARVAAIEQALAQR